MIEAAVIEALDKVGKCLPVASAAGQRPSTLLVKHLRAKAWWTGTDGPQVASAIASLESRVLAIQKELAALLDLPQCSKKYGQGSVSKGQWLRLPIFEEGVWNRPVSSACPQTVRALSTLGTAGCCRCLLGQAYFSLLSPGTEISPHFGVSNCKLRVQLCLSTGSPGPPAPVITVNGASRGYTVGRALVFDDSFLHSVSFPAPAVPAVPAMAATPEEEKAFSCAASPSAWAARDQQGEEGRKGNRKGNRWSGWRAVLLLDIWHPDLPKAARLLVQQRLQRMATAQWPLLRQPTAPQDGGSGGGGAAAGVQGGGRGLASMRWLVQAVCAFLPKQDVVAIQCLNLALSRTLT